MIYRSMSFLLVTLLFLQCGDDSEVENLSEELLTINFDLISNNSDRLFLITDSDHNYLTHMITTGNVSDLTIPRPDGYADSTFNLHLFEGSALSSYFNIPVSEYSRKSGSATSQEAIVQFTNAPEHEYANYNLGEGTINTIFPWMQILYVQSSNRGYFMLLDTLDDGFETQVISLNNLSDNMLAREIEPPLPLSSIWLEGFIPSSNYNRGWNTIFSRFFFENLNEPATFYTPNDSPYEKFRISLEMDRDFNSSNNESSWRTYFKNDEIASSSDVKILNSDINLLSVDDFESPDFQSQGQFQHFEAFLSFEGPDGRSAWVVYTNDPENIFWPTIPPEIAAEFSPNSEILQSDYSEDKSLEIVTYEVTETNFNTYSEWVSSFLAGTLEEAERYGVTKRRDLRQ